MNLILASSSPYRKDILVRAGFCFVAVSPDIDETPLPHETAPVLAQRLAEGKARALVGRFPDSLIIGADQVAECNHRLLGKPGHREAAIGQLEQASGRVTVLYSGIALINTASGHCQVGVDRYEVEYRHLSRQQIENYVDQEQPYDCCGGLKVEGPGIRLLKRLTGNDPNTLLGLPLIMLTDMIQRTEGTEDRGLRTED